MLPVGRSMWRIVRCARSWSSSRKALQGWVKVEERWEGTRAFQLDEGRRNRPVRPRGYNRWLLEPASCTAGHGPWAAIQPLGCRRRGRK
jgi:hypothetical protein